MNGHGRGRRDPLVTTAILLAIIGLVMLIVGGCGGANPPDVTSSTTTASSMPSEGVQSSANGEGVLLAKDILATFDELVAKVAEAAKGNPEAAVLKPRLEQLYESYMPKMTQLNGRYLALRDSGEMSQFGGCNTYLGEYRGQHVFDKDNVLTDAVRYYNLELGDQEMVSLLSNGPVELLDVAVNQG